MYAKLCWGIQSKLIFWIAKTINQLQPVQFYLTETGGSYKISLTPACLVDSTDGDKLQEGKICQGFSGTIK